MQFVPELCFLSLKKFISILWCKEVLEKTTGFIWELRLVRFQWLRYHDSVILMSAWGKGFFSATPCLWMPTSLSCSDSSQQGRGRCFSLKQRDIPYKRETLLKKKTTWNWRLTHCDISVDWPYSEIKCLMRRKKSEFSKEIETEMSSKKLKIEWKFRTEFYLNTCAMVSMSKPLQQDNSKLSVWISAREWKSVICIILFLPAKPEMVYWISSQRTVKSNK